jgi:hypothetical protein
MSVYQGLETDQLNNVLLPTTHSMADIEYSSTASKAYQVGDLMVFNNQLCQVTQTISSGGTITLGTNVLSTMVSEQLANIRVYVDGNSKLHFVDHAGRDTQLNI